MKHQPHVRAVVGASLLAAAAFALDQIELAWRPGQLALQAAALFGCGLATARLRHDDPPFSGWLLLTLSIPLAVASQDVFQIPIAFRNAILVLANLCWVVAVASLSRVLTRSGLLPPMPARVRTVVRTSAAAAVFIGCWTATFEIVRIDAAAASDFATLAVRMFTLAADLVVFVLAIRLFGRLIPAGDGAVAVPYFLLGVAAAGFFALDVGLVLAAVARYQELGSSDAITAILAFSWSCIVAAGWAQERLFRGARVGEANAETA